jgi:hydroxymethylbilane synthase
MTRPSGEARRVLVLGTRGSALARAQAEEAQRALRERQPGIETALRVLSTGGDRNQAAPLSVIGGQGVFTKELQLALLDGSIDAAVHSLKDLPPVAPPGLAIAAFLARADARDALISRGRVPLASLPAGSRVGTGSARRRAFLLRARPDLDVQPTRGNVDTRVRRVREGQLEAVVLAMAGLARLGLLDEVSEVFAEDVMIPSPGQGVIAIETRADDAHARAVLSALDDSPTRACALAEREFLKRLGAGCSRPAAAYGTIDGDTIRLRGALADDDGGALMSRAISGRRDAATVLGASLGAALLAARHGLPG